MSLDELSDEELVARIRGTTDTVERERSINELFRRHCTRVARWCLRFAADRESAADLAQEILAKAYQRLDSFEGQSKFSTWLFVIARNHCLNAVRANARQATELSVDVDDEFLSALPDAGQGPQSSVEHQYKAKLVHDLMNKALDETEKTVFTLHYGEELPLETITRLLGLDNASGAKAYIVSAKRKLARLVQRTKIQGQHF